ncbi:MAG: FMN-binding protein [Clostridia bacterium]|nr:FMN-binding protein [Clostridia bacterium]
MANKQTGKAIAVLAALFVVFSAAMFGLNFVTGPMIEANNASQAYGPLFAVMPEADDFEPIYMADGSVVSTLVEVPETVKAVYKETSGLGYALKMSTTKGYTGNAIELTFGVNNEGKISGIQLDAYPESKDFGAEYPGTFVGQDSTLAGVQIVSGCTYSSVAFRDAVADGMNLLIANDMMAAGVKSDDQLLSELIPTVHTGLVNNIGAAQYEELEGDGASIVKILKARNNSGFGYMMKDGDVSLLAVVNASGSVKVYNTEGADVTADYAAAADTAKAHAEANIVTNVDKDTQRLNVLMADATVTAIPVEGVFNSVTSAYKLEKDGATYYGLVSRSYGYDNEVMGVYYILDEQGAIVGMMADELIFHAEYFSTYTLDPAAYKAGFQGLTADTWTGEQAIISGATMTSDAVKTSTNDIFEAYNILKGGAAE